jgi:Tfp pilus assembly PilM family ATPase
MPVKNITSVGIEYDNISMRAVQIRSVPHKDKHGGASVESLHEIRGDFGRDDSLADGFREMAKKTGLRSRDRVVTTVSGKQIFVSRIKFKKLPDMEMKNALRYEIRKNLSYEAAGTVIDYQFLDEGDRAEGEKSNVMVTAVSNALLDRQVQALSRAGISPWIVEVLPITMSNAFWARRKMRDPGIAHVLVHLAPDVCNIVIDGQKVPFFTRSIYFSSVEIFGGRKTEIPDIEKKKRLNTLGDELRRSLSFYEKEFGVSSFGWISLIGNYAGHTLLLKLVGERLGLKHDLDGILKRLGKNGETEKGKFDLAAALALRGIDG